MTRPTSVPKPRREYGQHFLVDRNILGVIGRLAALGTDDVVLEVGPGLGVLTTFLADRVRYVHAVEIDRSLEPALRQAIEPRANVGLVFGDAVDVDVSTLRPTANKLVANLPYNVAATIVLDSLESVASVELWCVMVQREVGERFFAQPSTKQYGAVSVLVQLLAQRTVARPVSRTVFRPQPRVDSMLVAFRRVESPPAQYARIKEVVQASFAHRRKTLPNSLELAGLAERGRGSKALAELGHGASARAESLSPHDFARLTELLG